MYGMKYSPWWPKVPAGKEIGEKMERKAFQKISIAQIV